MDGHPRQNPAYRPAKGKALETGLFLWDPIRRRLVRLTPRRADCGLRGTARRGRPAWPRGPCRYEPLREREANRRAAAEAPLADRRSPFAELTTSVPADTLGAYHFRPPRSIPYPVYCMLLYVRGMHGRAGEGEGRDTRSHREAVEGREPRSLGGDRRRPARPEHPRRPRARNQVLARRDRPARVRRRLLRA